MAQLRSRLVTESGSDFTVVKSRSQLSYDFTYDYLFKILICGDCSVGKTSVMSRFVSNKFRVAHIRTIGVDFMMKYLVVQEKRIQLKIWDTAGQEEYDAITKQYFRRAQGILLAYDITNQKSFNNLQIWINKLQQSLNVKIPIVLLGNKVDLEAQRCVPTRQGLSFAQKHNMRFFETSCLTSVNITEAVCCLVEKILWEVEPPKPIPETIPGSIPGYAPEQKQSGYVPEQKQFNSTVTPNSEPPTSKEQSFELSHEPEPPTTKSGWCSC